MGLGNTLWGRGVIWRIKFIGIGAFLVVGFGPEPALKKSGSAGNTNNESDNQRQIALPSGQTAMAKNLA